MPGEEARNMKRTRSNEFSCKLFRATWLNNLLILMKGMASKLGLRWAPFIFV